MTKIAALVLALIAARSAAQDFPVHYLPEPDFESIVYGVVAPLQAKDAFGGLAECSVIDARTFVPVTLAKAQEMVAPCVAGLGRRYGISMIVERMAAGNEVGTQIEGLALWVPGNVSVTSAVMKDLHLGLSLRNSRILGHPATVRRGAAPSADKPACRRRVSAAQAAIDRCMVTMVLRHRDERGFKIRPLPHFSSELKVKDLRPAPDRNSRCLEHGQRTSSKP